MNSNSPNIPMNCHMYENELPEEGDLVMVKIISVNDGGAQCKLLEYGGIEALLPSTEYSRKRIRSIKKLVRPGKKDVLTVMRVDTQKHYIDLSKKHVTKPEIKEVSSKFQKSNFVHSCMKQICIKHKQFTLEDMYKQIGWPLYHDFGHAFNGLEKAAKDFSILDKYKIDEEARNELKRSLDHRFKEKEQTVCRTVTVSCVGVDGINAIRDTLVKAKNECNNTNDSKQSIQINILKCPDYQIITKGMNVETMTNNIQKATDLIKQYIESYDGGAFGAKEITVQ